jgi:hypothetical protein
VVYGLLGGKIISRFRFGQMDSIAVPQTPQGFFSGFC